MLYNFFKFRGEKKGLPSILSILFLFFFFSFTFVSASSFGYNYLDSGDKVITGGNYTINTNYSNNAGQLEGRNTASLYNYFKGLFDSIFYPLNSNPANYVNQSGDDWLYTSSNLVYFNDSQLSTTYFNATQSQIVAGTVAGSLGDTQHPRGSYDDKTINITEQAGSPALDVRINFTDGIDRFNAGVMRYYTSNIQGELPIVQLWDYEDNDWEDYPRLISTSTWSILEESVFDYMNHVQNGTVQMRLYKASNGNINNHYYVDWLAIAKGYGVPAGEETDPLSYHKNENINATGFNGTFDYLTAGLTTIGSTSVEPHLSFRRDGYNYITSGVGASSLLAFITGGRSPSDANANLVLLSDQTSRFNGKLAFKQLDGNEYIDSLNDGYMDYGATTAHRFSNKVGIGATSVNSRFQVGPGSVSQEWSGSTPYVYIQGMDNEVATVGFAIDDENMNRMIEVGTYADSGAVKGYLDVRGNLIVNQTITTPNIQIPPVSGSCNLTAGAGISKNSTGYCFA